MAHSTSYFGLKPLEGLLSIQKQKQKEKKENYKETRATRDSPNKHG
jgi:hypothetical protein